METASHRRTANYRRTVTPTEAHIHRFLEREGIAPRILSERPIPRGGKNARIQKVGMELEMERYETTLTGIQEAGGDPRKFFPAVDALIDRLHALRVLHGDLHSDNIVVNPATGDVRLIDFDTTYAFEEIEDDMIPEMARFMHPDMEPVTSLAELLEREKRMYRDTLGEK